MAYNTVPIKKDVDNKPIPQYYNPISDAYEVLQGRNGANKVELYDADGNSINLAALFASIVTALGQVQIANSALPTGAATEAKQNSINTALEAIETMLTTIRDSAGIKKITDPLPSGTNKIGQVDVASSALPEGASTAARQDSIIAAINTVIQQLQEPVTIDESALPTGAATETKQDAIITAIATAIDAIVEQLQQPVMLGGSAMEYYGKSGDEKPTPDVIGSTFFEIDTKTVYIWDGVEWVVI